MTLEEAAENIGREVGYYAPGFDIIHNRVEYGVITSVNSKFVFVQYGSDKNSKATTAHQLRLDPPIRKDVA